MPYSFRTEIPIEQQKIAIKHGDEILIMGSCFAEHIGRKLKDSGFSPLLNPMGIIFNPIAISNILQRILEDKAFEDSDLSERNGTYSCFEVHGKFSSPNKDELVKSLNRALSTVRKALLEGDWLILTLGSAWGYHHLERNLIAANCHKYPQQDFTKVLIESEDIASAFHAVLNRIHLLNPKMKILLTLSPVRHWKDGALNNSISKAHLRIACDKLEKKLTSISYFPAYEIVVDELRDYRFYEHDMLHPTPLTISYVWDKFQDYSMTEKVKGWNKEFEKLSQLMAHKSESEEHVKRMIRAEKMWEALVEESQK